MAEKPTASIPMLGVGTKSMKTTTQKISPSMPQRLVLATDLSLLVAFILATVIPQFKPGFFGSDFEGSSGYMAAFIFIPAVMLALTPILVLLLRHVSLLTYFSLCFLLQIVPRFFFFNLIFGYWMGDALWLGRLIALSWEIIKQWRSRA